MNWKPKMCMCCGCGRGCKYMYRYRIDVRENRARARRPALQDVVPGLSKNVVCSPAQRSPQKSKNNTPAGKLNIAYPIYDILLSEKKAASSEPAQAK